MTNHQNQVASTGRADFLAAFDEAIAQELPKVSHLEYDSHEICKHFAGKVRAILALRQPASAPAAEPAESTHVEVVGEIVATADGNDVRWSIEGGADAIPEGMVLLVADRPITDGTGSGEVYTHAQPAREPMTKVPAWLDVSACPDGDVWFSLSCGHVILGYKHGPVIDWETNVDHDCCGDASAIKAMPVTPPAHHGITAQGECWCHTCRPVTLADMRMVLCPTCGNKRCPKANDHRNACTDSNEPGQPGSAYPCITAQGGEVKA